DRDDDRHRAPRAGRGRRGLRHEGRRLDARDLGLGLRRHVHDGRTSGAAGGVFLKVLYTMGTKNSVETVAKSRPPMTARPSGAFCSPPSPSPRDIGSMPMIIAKAVISTGRRRVNPASSAAVRASAPSFRRSFANVTIRMLLAVATPIAMIAPMSDGTFTVVW